MSWVRTENRDGREDIYTLINMRLLDGLVGWPGGDDLMDAVMIRPGEGQHGDEIMSGRTVDLVWATKERLYTSRVGKGLEE